jgi:uncharacterized protein (DUF2164 family)
MCYNNTADILVSIAEFTLLLILPFFSRYLSTYYYNGHLIIALL